MKKQILSMLLVAVMVITMLPTLALAEGEPHPHTSHECTSCTHVDGDPHKADDIIWTPWNGTNNITYTDNVAYVYLSCDARRGNTLTVGNGKTLYLCLNGYTLRFNGYSGSSNITVENGATLVLTDCSTTGTITGGKGCKPGTSKCYLGGGVYNAGTFIMYGGKIDGNEVENIPYNNGASYYPGHGGGVYNAGTFTMHGGTISNNSAIYGGGLENKSSFTMTGGEISGNSATKGGGLFINTAGGFTMTGGEISGNSAAQDGGGLCSYDGSFFTMTGGTISGNTAGNRGGGVYTYKPFNLSGNPVINGNFKGTGETAPASNVYLDGMAITVNGTLNDGAKIGVTRYGSDHLYYGIIAVPDGENVTTLTKTDAAKFTSDKSDYTVQVDGGKLKLAAATYDVWVGDVQVSPTNADDVLGDGTVSFNPTTKTLTLKNFSYSGPGYEYTTNGSTFAAGIYSCDDDLEIILEGTNEVTCTTSDPDASAIAIRNGSLTIRGTGSLTATGGLDGIYADETITVSGGTVAATGTVCGINGHTISISGGTVNATGGYFGIYAYGSTITISGASTSVTAAGNSSSGIAAFNDITISGGTVEAAGSLSGIDAGGNITISGGTVEATGGLDGIYAAGDITTSGGTVAATGGSHGLNAGGSINTSGGTASVTVTSVMLNKASATLTVGGTETLTATVAPADATDPTVTWSSSNPSVVTVDSDGKITAAAAGTADITATAGGKTATCTVTVSAPYYGGDSGSSSSSNITTTTEKNPDGSTTTITTNTITGTVTETTKNTDGSTTTVETKKDGSATETQKNADGTTATTVTDKNGNITEISAKVPASAAGAAEKTGKPVTVPMEVPAAKSSEEALSVKVDVPANGAAVEIPVKNVTPGTVVVIVSADGSETVVSTTALTGNGVVVALEKDATIKVVDNAKAFTDVPATSWAKDAVDFASARSITEGTSETTFSPAAACTRAQMVTFLWRAAGCPEPSGAGCDFSDVDMDSYYGKAVLWAVENGITNGTSDTAFCPDMKCSRAQMAAFLCRMADGKGESDTIAFTDVKADAYYAESVQWAVENGVTNGTGDNKFNPDDTCTRAQMVTFLYRYFVK